MENVEQIYTRTFNSCTLWTLKHYEALAVSDNYRCYAEWRKLKAKEKNKMQEEILYIPVHITKTVTPKASVKSIWNAPVRISQAARNRLLAVILTELGILSVLLTGDGTAAFAALFIAMSAFFAK